MLGNLLSLSVLPGFQIHDWNGYGKAVRWGEIWKQWCSNGRVTGLPALSTSHKRVLRGCQRPSHTSLRYDAALRAGSSVIVEEQEEEEPVELDTARANAHSHPACQGWLLLSLTAKAWQWRSHVWCDDIIMSPPNFQVANLCTGWHNPSNAIVQKAKKGYGKKLIFIYRFSKNIFKAIYLTDQ